MASRRLTRTFWILVKLAVCGTSILIVGWAVLVFDGAEVQEASADIISLSPVPLTNTARFENALEDVGHSQPRSYEFNGNEVAFSTAYSDKHPPRIIEKYQRAFVRHGLNEAIYPPPGAGRHEESSPTDHPHRRRSAMLSGQPIPLTVGENYASMGAALIAGKPDTRREATRRIAQPSTDEFHRFFQGYRLIEIFRDPESGSTSVTASWSRGDFQMKRHFPTRKHPEQAGRPTGGVPACPNCLRMLDFAGRGHAAPYDIDVYGTSRDKHQIARFYDREMAERGWRQARSSRIFNHVLPRVDRYDVDATVRRYKRGERSVSLGIRRHPTLDKTLVTTYQSQ